MKPCMVKPAWLELSRLESTASIVTRVGRVFLFAAAVALVAALTLMHSAARSQIVSAAQSTSPTGTPAPFWWEGSVWENPERDYKWYPPDPEPARPTAPTVKPEGKPLAPKPMRALPLSDFRTTKEVQEHLNQLKDQAVMRPTDQHVKEYYTFQLAVLNQGSVFADVARRVIWTTPEIDYSQRRPYNNTATLGFNERQIATARGSSAKLSQSHGLFFFFRGNCPYCHQMAPILKAFQQQTGMEILPVSLDGGSVTGFSNAKIDNGLGEALQVKMVPAIYLVERSTKAVKPIGFGVIALNSLIERIHVLTQTKPGEEF